MANGVPRSRLTRQSFRPGGGARRLTEWAAIVATTSVNVGANTDILLTSLTGLDLEPLVPCTLVRIRGEILFDADQNASDETQLGSLGIGVVQDAARVVGPPSIPSAFVDAGDEVWMYWRSLMNHGAEGIVVSTNYPPARYDIDAKAMRKIVDGEALIVAVSNHSALFGFRIMFQARFLFLLH